MNSYPSVLTMRDLFADPALRSYLSNLRDWHGYIRFLGLPDRRDHPDIIVDRLFVRPLLTGKYVSPDEDPKDWVDDAEPLLTTLTNDKPMVLLGDPGTGKSALVNYLIWLLARPSENGLVARIGWHLPVPMVLRELRLEGVTDFDGLQQAFLQHPMSEPLRNGALLRDSLSSGRCLILLDGIDEIGDVAVRKRLRTAVADGVARYSSCRWLLTSRIVGYDEAPFDPHGIDRGDHHFAIGNEQHHDRVRDKFNERATARSLTDVTVRYIAPFDDVRIKEFARRWYDYRDMASSRAQRDAAHLVNAVFADDAILRLGRIPHLLTMMALIHRVEATLPQERALLYDRITEAYLESIDKFRGIYSGAADLPFKKRWLARVGFEMQRRRYTRDATDRTETLVDGADVLHWIRSEMERNPSGGIDDAEQFVQFVKRRSGLLLPRGESKYAFIHLSFQEYFAAHALKREVTTPTWVRKGTSQLGVKRMSLADWARSATWTETFIFLFEMLSPDEDWYDDLRAVVFGDGFWHLCNNERPLYDLNHLLYRVSSGRRSRFSASDVIDELGRHENRNEIIKVDLWGLQVSDLAPIANLPALRTLSLEDSRISDLTPLSALTFLQALELYLGRVSDISPIGGLVSLRTLETSLRQVSDISPIARLTSLRELRLMLARMVDLTPLSDLVFLDTLILTLAKVSDISALSGLKRVKAISLEGTHVSDITSLSKLKCLRILVLDRTSVSDLGPLAERTSLRALSLSRAHVSDLAPLSDLKSLRTLSLRHTPVSDLGALAGIKSLRMLSLDGIPVSDIRPILGLTSLRELHLGVTRILGTSVKKLRNELPYCKITVAEERGERPARIGQVSGAVDGAL